MSDADNFRVDIVRAGRGNQMFFIDPKWAVENADWKGVVGFIASLTREFWRTSEETGRQLHRHVLTTAERAEFSIRLAAIPIEVRQPPVEKALTALPEATSVAIVFFSGPSESSSS